MSIPVLCTRRLPDRLGDPQALIESGDVRRRHDRAAAHGKSRSRRSCSLQGNDRPPRPCTYCNKCLANVLENPLGCYDESRFDSHEEMIQEILSVFAP